MEFGSLALCGAAFEEVLPDFLLGTAGVGSGVRHHKPGATTGGLAGCGLER